MRELSSNSTHWWPDPRIALAATLATILAVTASTRLLLPLTVFGVCASAILLLGGSARGIAWRLLGPLMLAGAVGGLRFFLTGHTPLWSVRLCGLHLAATREGLAAGVLLGGRVLGTVSAAMVLGMLTSATEVFSALRWAHMPRAWVEIAMMMHGHIFGLAEQAASIRAAQRTRLGYGGFARSLTSSAVLVGSVTLRSLDQAQRTHEAMTVRGYRGTLHLRPLPALGARGWAAMLGMIATIVAAWAIVERGML